MTNIYILLMCRPSCHIINFLIRLSFGEITILWISKLGLKARTRIWTQIIWQVQLLVLDSKLSMARLLISIWCWLQSSSMLLYQPTSSLYLSTSKYYSFPLPDFPNISNLGLSMHCYMLSYLWTKTSLYSQHLSY